LAVALAAVAVVAVWPSAAARAQAPSQVVVYDASGSMYRSDTGEYRYRLAQAVVARLADAMRKFNVTTPTGMVVFGRQYFEALHICHDIEVPVPVPSAGAANPLDQIVSAAMQTKPNGQTPLLDAMVVAAEQMPPRGGVMTVVTDLDEETCGGDPCDIAARLEAIGKSLGSVVQVGFIVATGLQAGKNGQAVQDFANCVHGNLRFVDTLERAKQVADEIAASLAAWRPPAGAISHPLSVPAQANAPQADVVLTAGFSAPIIWPDWTFAEANAQVKFTNRLQQRDQAALQGNQVRIDSPPGVKTFNLFAGGGAPWGSAKDVTVYASQTNRIPLVVDPATITVTAVPTAVGHSLAGISFDWTIAGYGRRYVSPSHDARLVATVPPGTYDVSVTLNGGEVSGSRSFSLAGLGVAKGDHLNREISIELQALGTLTVSGTVAEPRLFASDRAASLELVLSDANGQKIALGAGAGPFSRSLPHGHYRIKLRTGGQDRVIADADIQDGKETTVELSAAPSRIVVYAKRADDMPLVAAGALRWTIHPSGGPPGDRHAQGPVLDVTVPAGTYQISAYGESDGAANDTLDVTEGRAVATSLVLRQ
jgi:hypothetical protein